MLYDILSGSKKLNEKNAVNILRDVTRLDAIGLNLDVPTYKLEEIRQTHSTDLTQCKIALISYWLKNDPQASWSKLADALEDDHRVIATHIRQKYVPHTQKKDPESCTTGNSRSRTPSPTTTKGFHSWTNPIPTYPTIVVSFKRTYICHCLLSSFT